MSKDLLDTLYDSNWKNQMYSLMSEASIFGLTVFGDGATITLINILTAGVNNPFTLLDVVDCTHSLPYSSIYSEDGARSSWPQQSIWRRRFSFL